MNSATLQKYQIKLEQLAARVRSDAVSMTEQVHQGTGGQVDGGLSNAPMHLGDLGTDEFLYDLNTTLLENEQFIGNEVRAALVRIQAGTYGMCESCGRAIAKERLEVMAFARYCVKCAAAADAAPNVNINDGRPRTPADTLAPEGEMGEDRAKRVDPLEWPTPRLHHGDVYAAGTAGGGTAVGGLAGSNEGDGDPFIAEIDEATGSGRFDADDDRVDDRTPTSGRSGGAVGGTPARKRSV